LGALSRPGKHSQDRDAANSPLETRLPPAVGPVCFVAAGAGWRLSGVWLTVAWAANGKSHFAAGPGAALDLKRLHGRAGGS